MKKLSLAIIVTLLISQSAFAATINSGTHVNMDKYETKALGSTVITATAEGEITAENGIRLMIDPDRRILWHDTALSASGTAVENGKVADVIEPGFTYDYKTLIIPVLQDFADGEEVVIDGLMLRSYDREISSRNVMLDVDDDGINDANDGYYYKVTSNEKRDYIPPYNIMHLEYELNDTKTKVTLTWMLPPDYDLHTVVIQRAVTVNGEKSDYTSLDLNGNTSYEDMDLGTAEAVHYVFYTEDKKFNQSDKTDELTVVLVEEEEAEGEPVEPEDIPAETEEGEGGLATEVTVAPETELQSLDRLYNYYKIRQEIKCREATSESSSACLWAEINLVYAQEMTGKSDVDTSISERDLYLMRIRIRWPEQRYQEKCVEAQTPDKTCAALEKNLDRARYFLGE